MVNKKKHKNNEIFVIHSHYVTVKYYCQLGSKIQVMIYWLDILAYWLPEIGESPLAHPKEILNNF